MSDNEKISMVVAIYNSEKFLPKLIESMIKQTYQNIEIILVDDGSPDNSGLICDEYAEKDSRIKVIHKKNGGTCDARNAGMKIATGEYLVIIDGDDWLELDFAEYMLNLVKSTNSDMGFSDKLFTTRDRVQIEEDNIEVWSPEKAAAAIIYPYMEIGPWNKIYSLKMLREHDLTFSTKWSGEGLYFASMAAQYSNQVAVGHKKVYNYRLNNAGSGLTNYKLEMGTNALENIKLIGDKLVLKTPKLINAVNWHIWKNNNFVIFLIVATNSRKENKDLLKECKHYIRTNLISVLIKSEIGIKQKCKMILTSIAPELVARKNIKIRERALAIDHME